MWNVLASIFAIIIFALITLSVDDNMSAQIQSAMLSKAEQQSAVLLALYAQAAHAYAQANNLPSGTTVSLSTLQSAQYLPGGFPTANAFGQQFTAVVGTTSATAEPIAAWFSTAPLDLKGSPNTPLMQQSVALKIAQDASVVQSNSAVQYGVAAGGAAPYTQIQLPFSTALVNVTSTVPSFSSPTQGAMALYLQ